MLSGLPAQGKRAEEDTNAPTPFQGDRTAANIAAHPSVGMGRASFKTSKNDEAESVTFFVAPASPFHAGFQDVAAADRRRRNRSAIRKNRRLLEFVAGDDAMINARLRAINPKTNAVGARVGWHFFMRS